MGDEEFQAKAETPWKSRGGSEQAARSNLGRCNPSKCLTDPSLCSVDLQQQIMTIVDELGKASAKVRGTSRTGKGKAGWQVRARTKSVFTSAGPAPPRTHHQCLQNAE